MNKISIVTPVYNSQNTIAETIDSVINQTYQNWEMIIVDDCSVDKTAEIVEHYVKKDKRIVLLRHNYNQGVAIARNTALKVATGNFIAFLDGDDFWKPEKLEMQLHFMEQKKCRLSYTAYQIYYENQKQIGKKISVPYKMNSKKIFYDTSIACLTVMVNKELVGDFLMPNLNHTEDQCTWQLILGEENFAYGLNESLAVYRVGNSSLTSNKFSAMKKQWKTYREFYMLPVWKSMVYFLGYGLNALKKYIK